MPLTLTRVSTYCYKYTALSQSIHTTRMKKNSLVKVKLEQTVKRYDNQLLALDHGTTLFNAPVVMISKL